MLYSRKIVLAIAACVALASASSLEADQKAERDAAQKDVDNANKKLEKAGEKDDKTELQLSIDLAAAKKVVLVAQHKLANVKKGKEHKKARTAAKAEVETAELAEEVVDAQLAHHKEQVKLDAIPNEKSNEQARKTQAKEVRDSVLDLEKARADHSYASATTNDQKAMAVAKLYVNEAERTMHDADYSSSDSDDSQRQKVKDQAELDRVKTVLDTLIAAEAAKKQAAADKDQAAKAKAKATKELAAMTTANTNLKTEKDARDKKDKEEREKNMFQQGWDYISSPVTKYKAARKEDFVNSEGNKGKLSFFGAVKYALTPSSGTGKAAYIGLAGAAAAGAFGGYKYVENGNEKRKSNSRKKVGLAVAGLAAAGAVAFGAYKGNEWYQAKQNAGEGEMFDDEETGAPQSSGKNSDPAPVSASGDQSKKNKNGKTNSKKKSNKWMIYAAVIVLALAVIGGAVYYFLFMTEEGSEEDAVPEGMDQV